MKKTFLALSLIVLVLITACSNSRPQEPKVDKVSILENRVASMMADIDAIRRAVSNNGEAVDELRDTILNQLRQLSADSARISVKFDNFEGNLDAMSERLDDVEFRMSNIRKEVNSLRISRTGTEFTRPNGTPDRLDTMNSDTGMEGEQTTTNRMRPTNDQESYQMAYNDYLGGGYSLATAGFRSYLQEYPDGTNAESARYYLAEALFNIGDFEAALEEYDTFILSYPESPQLVNAKYKKALSFLESNQTPSGVILLRQVINQYPDTNESRLASEKLSSLGLNP